MGSSRQHEIIIYIKILILYHLESFSDSISLNYFSGNRVETLNHLTHPKNEQPNMGVHSVSQFGPHVGKDNSLLTHFQNV